MAKDYIEERSGAYFIAGTRVSLDSVVHAFLRGESPEGIAESFPALTLEQSSGHWRFISRIATRSTSISGEVRKTSSAFDNKRTKIVRVSTRA
jgi:uncharacterized protein (DUF433 family)